MFPWCTKALVRCNFQDVVLDKFPYSNLPKFLFFYELAVTDCMFFYTWFKLLKCFACWLCQIVSSLYSWVLSLQRKWRISVVPEPLRKKPDRQNIVAWNILLSLKARPIGSSVSTRCNYHNKSLQSSTSFNHSTSQFSLQATYLASKHCDLTNAFLISFFRFVQTVGDWIVWCLTMNRPWFDTHQESYAAKLQQFRYEMHLQRRLWVASCHTEEVDVLNVESSWCFQKQTNDLSTNQTLRLYSASLY